MNKRGVVICGSMSFYEEMLYLKSKLYEHGVNAIAPDSDDSFYEKVVNINDVDALNQYKSMASRLHIRKIWRVSTRAILVVNGKKRNVDNYIGANSLAEVALAFALKKKIFLLYGVPAMYSDELSAWGAIPLMGDLLQLIAYVRTPVQEQLRLPGLD